MHGFEDQENDKEHVVLSMGDVTSDEPVLARIHSECLTGDALFSLRCDCGAQLQAALHRIAQEGRGVVFYLRQEGRGIGLLNKINAYALQDQGRNTVEANLELGFAEDERDYSVVKFILEDLNVNKLKLITNNPEKIKYVESLGVEIEKRIPAITKTNKYNKDYLDTKKEHFGHLL